jgi:hypothetical protein
MSTYKEKLSILSEMIEFARVDYTVKSPELNFLLGVAEQLGIPREVFDKLFEEQSEHLIPKTQADRILQFHRLVLLMNIDKEHLLEELRRLHDIGLGMGLPPSAIDQVVAIMHKYPDNVVPPHVLIDIFKAYEN